MVRTRTTMVLEDYSNERFANKLKYRKKPVIIEAVQWFKNGDHPLDYANDIEGLENGVIKVFTKEMCKTLEWEGQLVGYFRHPDISGETICHKCGNKMHDHGWIDTLEDGHNVCPGDYIIKGVKGEFYPCKNDIFLMTYEKVEE